MCHKVDHSTPNTLLLWHSWIKYNMKVLTAVHPSNSKAKDLTKNWERAQNKRVGMRHLSFLLWVHVYDVVTSHSQKKGGTRAKHVRERRHVISALSFIQRGRAHAPTKWFLLWFLLFSTGNSWVPSFTPRDTVTRKWKRETHRLPRPQCTCSHVLLVFTKSPSSCPYGRPHPPRVFCFIYIF